MAAEPAIGPVPPEIVDVAEMPTPPRVTPSVAAIGRVPAEASVREPSVTLTVAAIGRAAAEAVVTAPSVWERVAARGSLPAAETATQQTEAVSVEVSTVKRENVARAVLATGTTEPIRDDAAHTEFFAIPPFRASAIRFCSLPS